MSELRGSGRPRRYNANGLRVELRIDNDQHASEGVGSGQPKALLAMMVGIRHGTGQLVVENLNRIETDAVRCTYHILRATDYLITNEPQPT